MLGCSCIFLCTAVTQSYLMKDEGVDQSTFCNIWYTDIARKQTQFWGKHEISNIRYLERVHFSWKIAWERITRRLIPK